MESELNDSDFIEYIGKKIGSGNQGDVHEFGSNLVVKIWKKAPIN